MPLSFRPNAKVWIWLDSDKDIEESKRPAFACKVLTCEQVDAWHETIRSLIDKRATYDQAANALLAHVSDWRNFPEPFSATGLKKYLTANEIWSLCIDLVGKVGLAEDTLPLSDSQSPTGGEASANPVEPPAATDPPNANQS